MIMSRLPLLALLVLASLPAPGRGAPPLQTRNLSITGFDRVRIDGPYQVRLKTNVSPFARATGANAAALDSVAIKVEGRTLVVRPASGGWGGYPGERRGPVTIEVGTHELATVWLNGAGSLLIDKVRGLIFDLAINGAGSARIDAVDVDQFKLRMSGAGTTQLAGKASRLNAVVRGSSSFNGEALKVRDATINAEGPTSVWLAASETAKVDAMGLAAVNLSGNPACDVEAQGSASVSGCRGDRR